MSPRPSRALAVAALAALAGDARAGLLAEARKTTPAQLALDVQRYTLENGLVVVLAPDPVPSSVAVWLTFRAGALREPAGKSGLAHLVEHLLFTGSKPETDYAGMLEARRARHLNAHTGFDALSFETVLPAEELPAALWVAADRLATLLPQIDAREVERSRRVVEQERALRSVDAPYGLVDEQLFRRLYAAPHPLRGGVIGVPEELAKVEVEDVRRFVSELLVPSNAVLVVAGRFDPAVARELVAGSLGRLPPGRRPGPAKLPPPPAAYVDAKEEPHARHPRVTLAWRVPGAGRGDAAALRLGALFLTFLTDGAWGMRIGADVSEYEGEALFAMELTIPYDEPMDVVHRDADGFLRMLTHRELPLDFLIAANLQLDRLALFQLDDLGARAAVLSDLELRMGASTDTAGHLGWHWEVEGDVMRDTARRHLKGPKLVLHARPTRPKKARVERE